MFIAIRLFTGISQDELRSLIELDQSYRVYGILCHFLSFRDSRLVSLLTPPLSPLQLLIPPHHVRLSFITDPAPLVSLHQRACKIEASLSMKRQLGCFPETGTTTSAISSKKGTEGPILYNPDRSPLNRLRFS